jgi:hypothetical protein
MISPEPSLLAPHLKFNGATPVAPRGLGGLIRDHFANGRIFATVGHHGGLLDVSYWGRQHLGAPHFFKGALDTGWNKCLRVYVGIDDKRYYPTFNQTKLYPFGFSSRSTVAGVGIEHEMILLPDALVQRVKVAKNYSGVPVRLGMLHQEAISSTGGNNRTWSDLVFHPRLNAFIASCEDLNPDARTYGKSSLAQMGLGKTVPDAPRTVTWIGLGCDFKITTHRGYHHRSKHYILSDAFKGAQGAYYLVFADSRPALEKRLKQLSKIVHQECAKVVSDYETRLLARPQVDVGNPVLNSAFMQYPEMIEKMKLPDRPGATRGTLAGYFVWGWDGMMPMLSSPLANEPGHNADTLRFFQDHVDRRLGLPHQFTTAFTLKLKGPFPAQCQYITGLYHYTAITGDLSVAREVFPTCKYLLDQCRKDIVKNSGLVSGAALWPDFPEAMEENGKDISSMNNSLLYQGLRSMEYFAIKLGHPKLAAECRDWARLLRKNFIKYLYDEKKGFFISSCSSVDFKPRKHYCAQAVFWLTPFARELVSHAPKRISTFLDKELRSSKCLLTLPHWDTAWMADGNQLGSSYPAADSFYLGVHKLIGDDYGIKAWLGDVEWFWRHHTAPEALTPEAENEEEYGPDNWGGKQTQAVATWYAALYTGLAGLDFDHEGLTLTPWGHLPVSIRGLRLHGVSVDLKISGRGNHVGSLKLNGKALPAGLRKIAWKNLKGKSARIELIRSEKASAGPVVVRADGLRVSLLESKGGRLAVKVGGDITGEVVIQTSAKASVLVNGKPVKVPYDSATKTVSIPFANDGDVKVIVAQ